MSELISKDSALNCFTDWIDQYGHEHTADDDAVYQRIAGLKSIENCADAISRKMAIDVMCEMMYHWFGGNPKDEIREIVRELKKLPAAQPVTNCSEIPNGSDDTISRQAAIDAIIDEFKRSPTPAIRAKFRLEALPSAQPERTCVNCGRTANNGGWYADGRTRCPIEEHYALPKDGFCHLWEKRNITDDDYPERREE